jgi:hypothetical protein
MKPEGRSREVLRGFVIQLTAAVLLVLVVRAIHASGGPYGLFPETIFDHVGAGTELSRRAMVMARRCEPLMPRGSSLTVIAPAEAPNYDATNYLAVSAVIPRHEVRHPALADGERWPDFVIALGAPFEHPGFRLVQEFPEGRLYARR